jgi:3-oxoacyl-[acyl-carrier-protein] synthase-1
VSERVVVTGAGVVCAGGHEVDTVWERLAAGDSAIAPIGCFDASAWRFRQAGEIADFDARTLVPDRKLHKLIRRSDMLGLYAADRAVAAAGWGEAASALNAAERVAFLDATGVFVGSGGGSYANQCDFLPLLHDGAGDLPRFGAGVMHAVHPMWLLRSLPNNVLCHIGIRHGFRGPNSCIVNHSSSGALALIEAVAALRAGKAERVLAVAHEAPLEPQTLHYFASFGLLTPTLLRPFDRRHDGTLLGEAGAALCLEGADAARQRGAPILGEVLAGSCVTEAEGLLAVRDDGAGVEDAIRLVLQRAGVAAAQVGMIAAHGNGTPPSDVSEALALGRVFGAAMPPVTAFKWAFGHTLAASALLELVLALESLRRAAVPGVAPLEEIDPRCGDLAMAAATRPPRGDTALVVSRGFAGVDAALLIAAPAPPRIPDSKFQISSSASD